MKIIHINPGNASFMPIEFRWFNFKDRDSASSQPVEIDQLGFKVQFKVGGF